MRLRVVGEVLHRLELRLILRHRRRLSLSSLSGPVEILVAQTQFTGLTSTILTSMQREWDELGLEWPALALEVAVRLELTRPHACLSPA